MQIRNNYKNKNTTKNAILWTILFGILNYLIIILSSFRMSIAEGLEVTTDYYGPVLDEKTKTYSKKITVKDVTGKISFKFDMANKMTNINIDDALVNAIIPKGVPGVPGAQGIQGIPGIVEITNKTSS
jgi:hypothetical protein